MTEYEIADAEFNAAFAIFNPILVAFTDIKIAMKDRPTYEQWAEAKKMQKTAIEKFDAAWEKASKS